MNRKSFFHEGMRYTIASYILKALNFFAVPIFTFILSTFDYGVYSIYFSWCSIFCLIIGLSVHTTVKSAYYQYTNFEYYIWLLYRIPIVLSVLAFIILELFSTHIVMSLGLNKEIIICIILYSEFESIMQIFYQSNIVKCNFRTNIVFSFVYSLSNIFISVILCTCILLENRYWGRIIGGIIPNFILVIYILLGARRGIEKNDKRVDAKEYYKFAFKYCMPLIPHTLAQIILAQSDRIMINRYIGINEAGIYSATYSLSQLSIVLVQSTDNVWGAFLFKNLDEKNYSYIKKNSQMYTILITGLIMVMTFAVPDIMKIIVDQKYWEGIKLLPILFFSTFFIFIYTLFAQVEYYVRKTIYTAIASICVACINIILNYIFIPLFGYFAAAYTTLISYGGFVLVHYGIYKIVFREDIIDIKTIKYCSLVMLFASVATLITLDQVVVRYIVLLCMCGIFMKIVLKNENIIRIIRNRQI